ncbi:hypothetical protein [Henriciella sp.]|uniref:hypothetical protein n=1 Tax=Henriciella sp. TaxID=1968823 RepID=UPI0025C7111A|nr:hypothetical protein [Henriciella sp.]
MIWMIVFDLIVILLGFSFSDKDRWPGRFGCLFIGLGLAWLVIDLAKFAGLA